MATNITADVMLAGLKKWGVTPRFYASDWRTHNRNAQQGFGPINGVIVHNFGSDTSDTNSLAYLYRGDNARGMPGPLSQFGITDDGTVWVIGWGTANHGGAIDLKTHAMVLADKMPRDRDVYPTTTMASTGRVLTTTNARYLGIEMCYGKSPTKAQLDACVRLCAALMDTCGSGYTGGSIVGHRETTTNRSDPTGVPMGDFRKAVDALLANRPGTEVPTPPVKPTAPTPTAPPKEEDDMPTLQEIETMVRRVVREEAPKAVWEAPRWVGSNGVAYSPATWLKATNEKAGRAEASALKAATNTTPPA